MNVLRLLAAEAGAEEPIVDLTFFQKLWATIVTWFID